jgi:hypothetical protein
MESIKNSDGLVALQHYTTNPCTVIVEGANTSYTFVPKHNVSMAWVKPEHVDRLLAQTAKGCCGRNKQKKFVLASQTNANLWMYGNIYGEEKDG